MTYPKIRIIDEKDKQFTGSIESPTWTITITKENLIDLTNFSSLSKRSTDVFSDKAFYLPKIIDNCPVTWHIIKDPMGLLCLVPLRKETPNAD